MRGCGQVGGARTGCVGLRNGQCKANEGLKGGGDAWQCPWQVQSWAGGAIERRVVRSTRTARGSSGTDRGHGAGSGGSH